MKTQNNSSFTNIDEIMDVLVEGTETEITDLTNTEIDFAYYYDQEDDRIHIRLNNTHIIAHGLLVVPNCVELLGNEYGTLS